jgi:hypothetical protein
MVRRVNCVQVRPSDTWGFESLGHSPNKPPTAFAQSLWGRLDGQHTQLIEPMPLSDLAAVCWWMHDAHNAPQTCRC